MSTNTYLIARWRVLTPQQNNNKDAELSTDQQRQSFIAEARLIYHLIVRKAAAAAAAAEGIKENRRCRLQPTRFHDATGTAGSVQYA